MDHWISKYQLVNRLQLRCQQMVAYVDDIEVQRRGYGRAVGKKCYSDGEEPPF